MLLPVQQNVGIVGDPDAELAFGLQARGRGVGWILPADVEEVLGRSPSMQTRTHGLSVGDFLLAEVERVGDPLYGELRRMAALVDAELALLPVRASLERAPGVDPSVRFWIALIDIRTGRVAWFGVLEGEAFPSDDPRGLASAVDVLAHTLLWFGDDEVNDARGTS